MKFNKNWTKEDNDLMREMIKNKKTHQEIIDYFGVEKVLYHPKKKFHRSKSLHTRIDSFLLNEIKIEPKKTDFTYKYEKSLYNNKKNDIIVEFIVNDIKYIIVLFYMFENDIESYEILFTTKKQYILYKKTLEEILLNDGVHFTEDEQDILKNILENETGYNDVFQLFKSLSYILMELYDENKDMSFSVTETDNPIKIKFYKNLIQKSFPDFTYKKRKVKIGTVEKNMYYYFKK